MSNIAKMPSSFYGTVYRISHDFLPITYIGSTMRALRERKWAHKSHYNMYIKGKLKNPCSIHWYMKLHGYESFRYHTIGVFLCHSKEDLRMYEQIYIDRIPNINKYNARCKYTKQEYQYKYRREPDNREKAKLRTKKWKQKKRGISFRCHCGSIIKYPNWHHHKKTETHQNAAKKRIVDILLKRILISPTIVYTSILS